MDANTVALNQYMKEIEASDKAQDWKDDYIDELTREGGEYYPFIPKNFIEAITEADLNKTIMLAGYAHVTAKLAFNDSKIYLAEYAVKITQEYWKKCAAIKADADYDTMTRSL